MCLITYAPDGAKSLDWATLDYSGRQNNDGFGIAWYRAKSRKWVTQRSLANKAMRRVIERIPQSAPLIIHQRYATHGEVSIDNVHPFRVSQALLFHNGVISGTRADERDCYKGADGKWHYAKGAISDTVAFAKDELEPLVEAAGTTWLKHPKGKKMLEARIGSSVLAIAIHGEREPVLIGEGRGDWVGSLFYSNSYSRPDGRGYGFKWDMYAGEEWDDVQSVTTKGVACAYTRDNQDYTGTNWRDPDPDSDDEPMEYTLEQIESDDRAFDEWLRDHNQSYAQARLTYDGDDE